LPASFAVTPLVTDDADPAEFNQVEADGSWIFTRTASVDLHQLVFSPVFGIIPNGEIALDFGYQWNGGGGRNSARADGFTDLTLGAKYRFWQSPDERFKLGLRLDVKLPAAPDHNNLGSGKPDSSILFLFTHQYGKTYLDSNIGYNLIDLSHLRSADDELFIGQAIRRQLTSHWWLIGEVTANIPFSARETRTEFAFSAGALFARNDNLAFSALIGTAAGHGSPDLTSTLAVTIAF
jgi:hypothetical protein